jgi:hypothetical protein
MQVISRVRMIVSAFGHRIFNEEFSAPGPSDVLLGLVFMVFNIQRLPVEVLRPWSTQKRLSVWHTQPPGLADA